MAETIEPTNAISNDGRIVLCLSGGGFRATLFHLGVLRRLNEFGMLSRLSVVTSVSGGSILNGVLATRWSSLTLGPGGAFTNFGEVIGNPVERFCQKDLRTPLLIFSRLDPSNWAALLRDYFSVSANRLAKAYEPLIAGNLESVPAPGGHTPRFVFCATNVLTGACWQFHGGPGCRMGDFYAGYCDAGSVKVSEAVAASSAFTPGISALRLPLPAACPVTRIDPWGEERPPTEKPSRESDARTVLLTDGGVYDNMGVEPVWRRFKILLASEAGKPFASASTNCQFITSRLGRAIEISVEQVGAVRRRWLAEQLIDGKRGGALWTIHTLLEDFPIAQKQGYGQRVRPLISSIRTDLNAFSLGEIACLENHGYSLADAAIRSRCPAICPNPSAPFQWPFPCWIDEGKVAAELSDSKDRHYLRDVWRLFKRLGEP